MHACVCLSVCLSDYLPLSGAVGVVCSSLPIIDALHVFLTVYFHTHNTPFTPHTSPRTLLPLQSATRVLSVFDIVVVFAWIFAIPACMLITFFFTFHVWLTHKVRLQLYMRQTTHALWSYTAVHLGGRGGARIID